MLYEARAVLKILRACSIAVTGKEHRMTKRGVRARMTYPLYYTSYISLLPIFRGLHLHLYALYTCT